MITATSGPAAPAGSIDDLHAALERTPGVAAVSAPVADDPDETPTAAHAISSLSRS